MKWKSTKHEKPRSMRKVWISYYIDGISTKQYQTYAKVVGKDSFGDLLWHDFISGKVMNNSRVSISHWMETPDNPILL